MQPGQGHAAHLLLMDDPPPLFVVTTLLHSPMPAETFLRMNSNSTGK